MRVSTLKDMNNPLGVWLLGIIISLLFTGVLAPIAIWVNIEHSEILYQMRSVQAELLKSSELKAKLEVEYGRLISPYELEEQAKKFSMAMASSGQVRRLIPAQEMEEARLEKEKKAKELEEKALIEQEKARIALAKAEEEKLAKEAEGNNFILQESIVDTRKASEILISLHKIEREMLMNYIINVGNIDLSSFAKKVEEVE